MAKQQSLLPLILLLIFISVGAAIGYVVWSIATDIATKASQQMEAKHIKFGKDGVRIEIKELNEEDYVADTQRYVELPFFSWACNGLRGLSVIRKTETAKQQDQGGRLDSRSWLDGSDDLFYIARDIILPAQRQRLCIADSLPPI